MAGAIFIGQAAEPLALDLECEACRAKFRITPSAERVRARVIACMECGHDLVVPAYEASRGWKRMDHGQIFNRFEHGLRAPSFDPLAPPHKTPAPEPSAPAPPEPAEPTTARFQFETFSPEASPTEPPTSPRSREVAAHRAPHDLAADGDGEEDLEQLLGRARALRRGESARADSPREPVEQDAVGGAKPPRAQKLAVLRRVMRRDEAGEEHPEIDDASRPTEPMRAQPDASLAAESLDVAFEPIEPASGAASHAAENEDEELGEQAEQSRAEGVEAGPRSPERFPMIVEEDVVRYELEVGAQVIGPLDATSVHALLAGGLHGVARVRVHGEQGWRMLEEHDIFGIFFDTSDGDDLDRDLLFEDGLEDLSEALEEEPVDALIEEGSFKTLPIAALSAPPQLPAPPEIEGAEAPLATNEDEDEGVLSEESWSAFLDDVERAGESIPELETEELARPESIASQDRRVEAREEIALIEEDAGETLPMILPELDEEPPLVRDAEEVVEAPESLAPPDVSRGDVSQVIDKEGDGEVFAASEERVEVDPPSRRPRGMGALWGALLLLAIVGSFVAGVYVKPLLFPPTETRPVIADASEPVITLDRERAITQSLGQARTLVHLASRQEWRTRSRQRAVALELHEEGAFSRAGKIFAMLWAHERERDAALARAYASALVALGDHALAREIAIEGLLDVPGDEDLIESFEEAVRDDPLLHPEVQVIVPDEEIDQIRALGGGKSLSFKMRKEGKNLYAFKPAQVEWGEGWRAEIAAYLLCEAIRCGFDVPRSLPAKISREHFEELYGRHTSPKQGAYKERFGELTWVMERGSDGEEREYLHGVLKEWVPGFVEWPIEYVSSWRQLLDASRSQDELDRSFRAAFGSLRLKQGGKYWYGLNKEREGASTRELAAGISGLLLFDFLTGNWDRFSQVEAYYGVNNHFKDGRFLSLDNGAAFHLQPMQSVRARFSLSSRFGARFVAALRIMKPSEFNDVFFPEASSEGKKRLEVFWAQRDAALTAIDGHIEAYGEDAVLCFD